MHCCFVYRFLLAALLSLCGGQAMATAQAGDLILIDGKTETLNGSPLAPYLRDHPGALPEPHYRTTSNWEGYTASWEIDGDTLYLTRIEMLFATADAADDGPHREPERRNVLELAFPGQSRVAAAWYSGRLVIPRGKLLEYLHMSFESRYERYLFIMVDKGKVTSRQELDDAQYQALRNAPRGE